MEESKAFAASSTTSAEYNENVVSEVSTQATTNTSVAASLAIPRVRSRRTVQNFVLVWLDANINETTEDFKNSC